MSLSRIALAVVLACSAGAALAGPSSIAITGSPSSTTGGVNTSNGTAWNNSSSSYYGVGGTNYGNTYTWAGTAGGGVTISAWGNTATTASSTIAKGWVGDYGSNGFGITAQGVAGELNASNNPDASSPTYQHAVDNVSNYESMMFSFGSAVTLNGVSIGFKGSDADATVFVYTGAGDPAAKLAGQSYQSMLSAYNAATGTGGWVLAGNLFDMSTSGSNAFSSTYSSKYWMVGAYMSSVGSNSSLSNDSTQDAFKISGISVTPTITVPEPDSIALVGIAALGLALARRRQAKRA